MGIQLAPIEGTPFAGGTATGIIYLDANGLQRTDAPTVDASGNVTVGKAFLGEWSVVSNWMILHQSDQNPSTGYALAQSDSGVTVLNGATNVTVQVGGANAKLVVTSSGVAVNKKLTATAVAATDTPLVVNGAVGQTADLATIGGVTIDAASNLTVSDQATFEGKVTINGAGSEIFSAYDLGSFSVFNFGGHTYSNHTTRLSLHAGYTLFEHAAGASELQIKTGGGLEFWNTGTVQFFAANGSTPGAIETGQLTVSSPDIPASSSATGTAGAVSWDADYIYICTATDTWKRVAIATW